MGNSFINKDSLLKVGLASTIVLASSYLMFPYFKKKSIFYIEKGLREMRKERRPKKIILIRHGESQGNVDESIYATIPDNKLNLSEKGIEQALEAGKKLKEILGDKKIKFYVSPFTRTKQTFENITKSFKSENYVSVEDPRLREQEWGNFQNKKEFEKIKIDRKECGKFYYRFPTGESGADVYERVSIFLSSYFREIENYKHTINENDNFEYVVIVTHGLFIQLFLMKYFKWSVEEFHSLKNPDNCEFVILEKNERNEYQLIKGLKKELK